jgi:hypothetical protein
MGDSRQESKRVDGASRGSELGGGHGQERRGSMVVDMARSSRDLLSIS